MALLRDTIFRIINIYTEGLISRTFINFSSKFVLDFVRIDT
jgi:hypothetical protein